MERHIYNVQWLNFIKYIKMKEEAPQSPFIVGQYLDYCNAQNQWVPRIVLDEIESPSREKVFKIKDPRYNSIGS